MINKIKNNSFIKFLTTVGKIVLYIVIVLIVAIILIQRVSKNEVALGGYRLFTIISQSMKPVYNIGDMLFAKTVSPEEIKIGDDVVYEGKVADFKGKTVVHRVIEKRKTNGQYVFTTQGIANSGVDPEIGPDQIIGKIIYKSFILSIISKVVNNNFGFYFAVLVPTAILIVIEVVETIQERKKKQKKKDIPIITNDDDDII